MEKSKTYYWAVFADKDPLFEGTFTQCWKFFVEKYGKFTVESLSIRGIRVARKS